MGNELSKNPFDIGYDLVTEFVNIAYNYNPLAIPFQLAGPDWSPFGEWTPGHLQLGNLDQSWKTAIEDTAMVAMSIASENPAMFAFAASQAAADITGIAPLSIQSDLNNGLGDTAGRYVGFAAQLAGGMRSGGSAAAPEANIEEATGRLKPTEPSQPPPAPQEIEMQPPQSSASTMDDNVQYGIRRRNVATTEEQQPLLGQAEVPQVDENPTIDQEVAKKLKSQSWVTRFKQIFSVSDKPLDSEIRYTRLSEYPSMNDFTIDPEERALNAIEEKQGPNLQQPTASSSSAAPLEFRQSEFDRAQATDSRQFLRQRTNRNMQLPQDDAYNQFVVREGRHLDVKNVRQRPLMAKSLAELKDETIRARQHLDEWQEKALPVVKEQMKARLSRSAEYQDNTTPQWYTEGVQKRMQAVQDRIDVLNRKIAEQDAYRKAKAIQNAKTIIQRKRILNEYDQIQKSMRTTEAIRHGIKALGKQGRIDEMNMADRALSAAMSESKRVWDYPMVTIESFKEKLQGMQKVVKDAEDKVKYVRLRDRAERADKMRQAELERKQAEDEAYRTELKQQREEYWRKKQEEQKKAIPAPSGARDQLAPMREELMRKTNPSASMMEQKYENDWPELKLDENPPTADVLGLDEPFLDQEEEKTAPSHPSTPILAETAPTVVTDMARTMVQRMRGSTAAFHFGQAITKLRTDPHPLGRNFEFASTIERRMYTIGKAIEQGQWNQAKSILNSIVDDPAYRRYELRMDNAVEAIQSRLIEEANPAARSESSANMSQEFLREFARAIWDLEFNTGREQISMYELRRTWWQTYRKFFTAGMYVRLHPSSGVPEASAPNAEGVHIPPLEQEPDYAQPDPYIDRTIKLFRGLPRFLSSLGLIMNWYSEQKAREQIPYNPLPAYGTKRPAAEDLSHVQIKHKKQRKSKLRAV